MSTAEVIQPVRGFSLRRPALGLFSLALVLGLAVLANRLSVWGNRPFGRALLEYPLWAVGVGLLANFLLRGIRLRDKVSGAFRTELFLKTGLVLMGATINFGLLVSVGARGMVQALIGVTSVFFFAWFIAGALGLDKKLRAVMSSSVSICGVSAAIAAAGSVLARRETLAYITTLVVLFALPLMVVQPYLARALHLPDAVAGAWIGNNIDTTAAVAGAGAIFSEKALKVATIVKMSQNTLIGLAAFLLALYWVIVVEKSREQKPSPIEIWHRFPKFVLGFIAASLLVSLGLVASKQVEPLRNWFLTLAFVSIGLEFSWAGLKQIGFKPFLAYFLATVFNTFLALGLAWVLFRGV